MATGGQNTDEEFIAIDGIVATGTYAVAVAPTNAAGALDATWHDHGLTTSAGVTRSAPATRQIRRAWQKNVKLRTLTTEAGVRFQFILVQSDVENVGLFHGVPLVSGSLVTDPSREWPVIAFDFDKIDGDNTIREYAPKARVVEVGDQVAISSDTWGYPITIEAEYDDTLGGYTQIWYSEFETIDVPTLTTALPGSMGEGSWVEIIGTGLDSTVSVTTGGVATPTFNIISKTILHIKLPAGSSGSAPIIVTNAGGASSAKAYTRI